MATKTIVQVLCDISGEEGAETVSFAWDGKLYEIDLSSKERAKAETALAKLIERARVVGKVQGMPKASKRAEAPSSSADKGYDSAEVRLWWHEQYDKGNKDLGEPKAIGKLPTPVIEAFKAAQ